MKRNRIAGLASILTLLFAVSLPAESVVELFQKAKLQVKNASYDDALKTLAELDTESAKPGHENERRQLEAPLSFYRGVCEAALGRKDQARGEFQKYLGLVPNATIDASMYPKKAVSAFEDARRTIPGGAETVSEQASFAQAYVHFQLTSPPPAETPNEEWGNGPVKYLLTADEKREWARLTDPVTRSEFVTKFWASRDPKSETPNNEGKEEFQKRVAFADANFSQDETRGAMTDRGMVFVLCGPPTYVGRKPIRTGEDSSDAAGMSTSGRNDVSSALIASGASSPSGKSSSGSQAAIADRMTGPGSRMPDSAANWREVWHYRREVLPAGIPYQQVDFEFITRTGYGKNVLQRDSSALTTLDAARRVSRPPA